MDEKFFDKHFTVDDIDEAKELLKELHPGRSAPGEDEIHYHDNQKMDSQFSANMVNYGLDDETDNRIHSSGHSQRDFVCGLIAEL
ncbi:hypothetical protein GYMLUDRAFT_244032 [Collybiopsis luxurians FD-317 M1]|uniref:Uncharacterized protein n=1 Tax=Collybiopsis luxurians FD-317 M1 TaxID=944289 RepID=A0A0D0BYJ3_9AGAR|nr:hypothetical protein GYMLUDRAFT_244032 [Collybiopsis luxurians FD-317 M1]